MNLFGISVFILSFIACAQLTASPYRSQNLLRSNVPPAAPPPSPISTLSSFNPQATDDFRKAFRQISTGSERFSLDFIRILSRLVISRNINFIVSPFSVWSLLILLAEGSGGSTYYQLKNVLRLPDDLTNLRSVYRGFQRSLVVNTTTVELAVNQALYTDSNRPIEEAYAQILQSVYGADHIRVNFQEPTAAANQINAFVSQQTGGKIPELINEADVKDAQMLLTSAIYFKGLWTYPFNVSMTSTKPFFDENGNLVEDVQMMYQRAHFRVASINQLSAHVLEVPYGVENRLCMLLLLPIKGVHLSDVFDKLNFYTIESITNELHKYDHNDDEDNDVDLHLPRFKIGSDFKLNSLLEEMGMKDIFSEKANLQRISDNPIYVSSIIHKAIVEVNEEGTIAAAATGGTVAFKATPFDFNCNRPFGFLMVERRTGTLLFAGQVRRPNQF